MNWTCAKNEKGRTLKKPNILKDNWAERDGKTAVIFCR